ncbi:MULTISPECIES: chondroitinase-B domain-containing protein [unclassified Paenibacillus]|uniref:chondroitinase-B domain-containing protein n=1 Tax=unclassified Paenibacillus TaxID=185978 RepID=UPI0036290ED3
MGKKILRKVSSILTFVMIYTAINFGGIVPAAHAAPVTIYSTGFDTNEYINAATPAGLSDYDLIQPLPVSTNDIIPLVWYKGEYSKGLLQADSKIFVKTGSSGFYRSGPVSLKLPVKANIGSVATINVSTATYQNITVSYYARTQGSPGGTLYSEWSPDGGKTWIEKANTQTVSSTSFTNYYFTINDTRANDNAYFMFRFRSDGSNSVYLNVDDLTISGDRLTTKPVTAMQLNKSSAEIGRNETLQLSVANVTPTDATGLSIKWTSNNKNIATVDMITGLVTPATPVSPGSVTIRATNIATGIYRESVVTVLDQEVYVPVSGLALSIPKALVPGQSVLLGADVSPTNASNPSVQWSSSDTSVVSLDSRGMATAIKKGTTTITAVSVDQGSYSASSQIQVIDEPDTARALLSFGFVNTNDPNLMADERGTVTIARGTIDHKDKTITVKIPAGTDLKKLVASYETPGKSVFIGNIPQQSNVTVNDFSNGMTYKVYGLSNVSTDYKVIIQQRAPVSPSRNFYASTPDDVVQASKQAQPGDSIILKNGTWTDADIYFSGDGLQGKPITLKAETQGQVIFQGASRVTVSGSYLIVDGLSFIGRSANKLDGAVKFDYLSNNCRLTNTTMDDFNPTDKDYFIKDDMNPLGASLPKHTWIYNYGTYNRIDHNTIIRKGFTGETLRLWRGVVHHSTIDHNYFAERLLDDANGTEAIQVGMYLSPNNWDTKPSYSTIEHNLFYHWMGEIEIVSIKAHNTIFRYNTVRESRGTVALRISDNSEMYGNFFMQNNLKDSGGIRVYGSGHKIYNNYFSGVAGTTDQRVGIALQAGVSVPGQDTQPAKNAIVAFNTIVDSNYGITIGAAADAAKTVGPDGLILANNLIKGSSVKEAIFENNKAPLNAATATIQGNIVYGSPISTSLTTGIRTNVNPLLSKSVNEEVYRPDAASPVIGAAEGTFNFITDDMDGQIRSQLKDIGADQRAAGAVTRKPLMASDVGPLAPSSDKEITSFSFQGLPASYNGVIVNTNIAVTVPYQTDLSTLTAIFATTGTIVKIGSKAQVSGTTVNDFNSQVTYVVTAADGSTKSYTIVVNKEPHHQSSSKSSSGQGGGGGVAITGSQGTESVSVSKPEDVGLTAALDVKSGISKASITTDTLSSFFDKAKPGTDGIKTLSVLVNKIEGSKGYEISIPVSFLSANDGNKKLALKTEFGSIIVPTTMLKAADMQKSATASLLISKADTTQLPTELQKTLTGKPFIDLALKVGDSLIDWKSADSQVEVSLPYTLSSKDADPEHVVVWYVNREGKAQTVTSGKYDPIQGVVTFKTNHFSLYVVTEVYKTFADLANYMWAKKAIEVLASKAIVEGTQSNAYSPGTLVTRADFVLLLHRTLGLKGVNPSSFQDVNKDDYYYDAVGTAKALGIVDGRDDNLFHPRDTISRQDMMVMLDRALSLLPSNRKQTGSGDLNSYKDASSVSTYAVKSVGSLLKAGLIEGDSSYLYPQNQVTRAEAAVVLYRLYNQQ